MMNDTTYSPGTEIGDNRLRPGNGDLLVSVESVRPATALNILIAARANSFDSSLSSDLRRQGYAVTEAATLIEAIGHLSANRVDLLITDLHLDGSAGGSIIEVCRTTCPGCKIIASATWARDLVARDGRMSGVDYIVSAACRSEEVENILNRIVSEANSGNDYGT